MFDEDISLFFNANEHAEWAVWQSKNINVIFEKPYAQALGVASVNPFAKAVEADLTGIEKGQNILIRSTNYTIVDIQPNGTGILLLELKKV
ncbi:MAG TPA: hypothetical protein DCO68_10190 [Methylophilaceae bacterium]|nr:hypothetical protein [Methylophilaceae bacterium]